jgi:hypothetical protein
MNKWLARLGVEIWASCWRCSQELTEDCIPVRQSENFSVTSFPRVQMCLHGQSGCTLFDNRRSWNFPSTSLMRTGAWISCYSEFRQNLAASFMFFRLVLCNFHLYPSFICQQKPSVWSFFLGVFNPKCGCSLNLFAAISAMQCALQNLSSNTVLFETKPSGLDWLEWCRSKVLSIIFF